VSGFDLRKTSGLGLRYLTPVGPIGLDYGWKLDRREGETAAEWHFTIGAVF
jgi:outer membrane protein insertion porin family